MPTNEPTLQDVLGAGATQTATTITIAKADLPRLTPSANNTPESLLVGMLLRSKSTLTKAAFDLNTDQSIYVETGYANIVFRGTNNDQYKVDQLTFNLAKLDEDSEIDPDKY